MRVVSQVGQRKYLWDETDVRNDRIKKLHFLSDFPRSTVLGVSWIRYGLVFSLTTLLLFLDGTLHSSLASAMSTSLQMPAPAPCGCAQVTPLPNVDGSTFSLQVAKGGSGLLRSLGAWMQYSTWPLPFTWGIPAWAMGSLILLALMALLLVILLRRRRRRNTTSRPLPIASVPSLESSDGAIYFRLDGLDGAGLIIGRGKYGVDLPIEESAPYADTVSNQHARIYYDTIYGHVIIEDLDSTNGVYINGRQAPRKNLLKDGWVVGLGRLNLTYHDGESDTGPLDG